MKLLDTFKSFAYYSWTFPVFQAPTLFVLEEICTRLKISSKDVLHGTLPFVPLDYYMDEKYIKRLNTNGLIDILDINTDNTSIWNILQRIPRELIDIEKFKQLFHFLITEDRHFIHKWLKSLAINGCLNDPTAYIHPDWVSNPFSISKKWNIYTNGLNKDLQNNFNLLQFIDNIPIGEIGDVYTLTNTPRKNVVIPNTYIKTLCRKTQPSIQAFHYLYYQLSLGDAIQELKENGIIP